MYEKYGNFYVFVDRVISMIYGTIISLFMFSSIAYCDVDKANNRKQEGSYKVSPAEKRSDSEDDKLDINGDASIDDEGIEGSYDFSEAELQESIDDELKISSYELRVPGKLALSVGWGVHFPWSSGDFQVVFNQSKKFLYSFGVGGASYDVKSSGSNLDWQQRINSQTIAGMGRWFFFETIPLWFGPQIGLVRWDGRIQPETSSEQSSGTLAALESGFQAYGASVGWGAGFYWIWSNGIFLEYNLIGMGRGAVFGRRFTSSSTLSQNEVVSELNYPQSWGLVNFRVGLYL